MPLIDNDKPRSPMGAWWQASWLIGVAAWALLLQVFVFGSVGVAGSGIWRLLVVVGAALSSIDGIAYVRGGQPHHPFRRGASRDNTLHVVTDDGQRGVVVMNHIPASGGGGSKAPKGGVAHVIFYAAPRTMGDALLTGAWKLLGKVLGRDERRVTHGPAPGDHPTGEIHRRGAQTVLERHEPRYRIFRP